MSNSITHVAGLAMNIQGRVIQRCSVCGASLIDSKGQASPIEYDEAGNVKPYEVPTWAVDSQVKVSIGNPTHFQLLERVPCEDDPKCAKLDPDSCFYSLDSLPDM